MDTLRLYLGRVASLGVVAVMAATSLLLSCTSVQEPDSIRSFADPNYLHHRRARVAIVGDLQRTGAVETWRENNDKHRPNIIAGIMADAPDALVVLGDMVWWGASRADWHYFDNLMTPLRVANIGVLPVLGNHDYYGNDQAAMANVMQRWPWFNHDGVVRVIDSVAYVVINTNFDDIGPVRSRQHRRWFVKTLQELDADSRIVAVVVCGHHPPFTNSTAVPPDVVLQRYFVPSFVQSAKGTLWLSGHAHTYERFHIDGRQFIVAGGGGGPRQAVAAAQAATYADEYRGGPIRPLHHLMIERIGTALCVTMRPVPLQSAVHDIADVVVMPAGGTVRQYVELAE